VLGHSAIAEAPIAAIPDADDNFASAVSFFASHTPSVSMTAQHRPTVNLFASHTPTVSRTVSHDDAQ